MTVLYAPEFPFSDETLQAAHNLRLNNNTPHEETERELFIHSLKYNDGLLYIYLTDPTEFAGYCMDAIETAMADDCSNGRQLNMLNGTPVARPRHFTTDDFSIRNLYSVEDYQLAALVDEKREAVARVHDELRRTIIKFLKDKTPHLAADIAEFLAMHQISAGQQSKLAPREIYEKNELGKRVKILLSLVEASLAEIPVEERRYAEKIHTQIIIDLVMTGDYLTTLKSDPPYMAGGETVTR